MPYLQTKCIINLVGLQKVNLEVKLPSIYVLMQHTLEIRNDTASLDIDVVIIKTNDHVEIENFEDNLLVYKQKSPRHQQLEAA